VRVVHLTTELPYAPGGTGGATRQFYLLRRLVELGHSVTVVAPVTDAHEAETGAREVLSRAGIDYRPVRRPASRAAEVGAALVREPRLAPGVLTQPWFAWQFGVIWARARGDALRNVAVAAPDIITVEHDHLAGWVTGLDRVRPVVLSTQNATWQLYARRGLRVEAERYRRYTRRFVPRFDSVVAVSDADAQAFAELGARHVWVVPNGAPFDELEAVPDGTTDPTVLFTGSMDHPPNRDAALWLGREIWPRVLRELPSARLLIVGRGPQRALQVFASDPSIEVVGPVPDMEPYFTRATLSVAPLLSGGGTRIKILEALARGRAVVATPVGAEGLALEPGRDLLLRSGAAEFAAGVVELLRDPEWRRSLATAGRAAAGRRYNWRSLGDELAAGLREVSERHAASAARAPRRQG
jgi:polysaccharide biosynthesis protein PslH